MVWTDEKVAELARLWEEGKSTGEIGKALGVSKNSVVGKAHRLSLSARPSPIKRVARPVVEKVRVKKPAPASDAPKTSVGDLSGASCRWPFGDPREKDFHFCGKRAMAGKPYCDDHAALAYVSSRRDTSENVA
ncbi:MAG: global cell cycle regulator GcrA-like protein [Alphaproteobacteria bacterium RIFOXYD12_FULL_60_8]|nr:MAG: global cell cycle regulator GcrA-like protein [Alphaproteobacteria bacterium RIFOXYD12_FULL_60_8]